MAELLLRDLAPELVSVLRERAERSGRSIESEARAVLEASLGVSKLRALTAARRIRSSFAGRRLSDSAELLRGDRNR